MLQAGRWEISLDGATVLDLFAGTGALGLEALSRGARSAVFVEKARTALTILTENVDKVAAGQGARILRRDACRLPPAEAPVDLVFLDPPFRRGLGGQALQSAVQNRWLRPEALVLWEEAAPQEPPPGFSLVETVPHGESHLSIMQFAK